MMAIGVPETEFWHMTMRRIHIYTDSYKVKQRMEDEKSWRAGYYNFLGGSAVMSNFGAGLSGKRANAKYLEKPFMQMQEEENRELTEEEAKAEIAKMIRNEERWNRQLKKQGMKETVIKKKGDVTDG